jgi:5-histidylcysteine sulfoxide synthase
MSWDDLSKNEMSWPSVADVTAYRREVYAAVRDVILTHPCLEPGAKAGLSGSPAWAVFMAFEHERIHIETSTVLMRELPARCVAAPREWPAYHPSALPAAEAAPHGAPCSAAPAPRNELRAIAAGTATLGKPLSFPTFGWDNEYGSRAFSVPAFSASAFLVSNGEFLEFVRAGGYATQRHWGEDGWRWRSFRNAKWPPFWVPDGPAGLHAYALRLLFDVVPMPWALPAIVNAHEARAFASWAAERDGAPAGAYRLPTEPEHARLRETVDPASALAAASDAVCALSGVAARPVANVNLAWSSECAVDALPASRASGVHDTLGNAWEWCHDDIAALPGFKVHPFYDDFSTPCFDGEHSIIAGGSWASTGDLASRFARFHFRPHFHQHAGFRLVRSAVEGAPVVMSCADAPGPHAGGWVPPSADPSRRVAPGAGATASAEAVARALLTAYGTPAEVLGGDAGGALAPLLSSGLGFAARCAALLSGRAGAAPPPGAPPRRALDVGAGVGALTFALAATYDSVLGVEHNAAAVAAAEALRTSGAFTYARKDDDASGAATQLTARPPAPPAGSRGGAVAFRQMDPCCLAPDLGAFDAVVVNNVLDTLPAPRSCLGRMGGPRGFVAPGGLLLVTCGHAWSETRTPREAWLPSGGADAAAGVGEALGAEFVLLEQVELPLLSREHARKFDVRLVHASLWQRQGVATP